jgi:uracil-DNA glycosylase
VGQGVLLLNAALTVRGGTANSHATLGWHQLTAAAVAALAARRRERLVFLLWGKFAQERARGVVDAARHHVLTSPHPSGLSAARVGCVCCCCVCGCV